MGRAFLFLISCSRSALCDRVPPKCGGGSQAQALREEGQALGASGPSSYNTVPATVPSPVRMAVGKPRCSPGS